MSRDAIDGPPALPGPPLPGRATSTSCAGGPERGRAIHTIGCVEDDATVRELLAAVLRFEGYDVRAFGTVRSALVGFEQRPIDLLLTDLDLPDGSGLDLAEEVRRRRPVPFILMSGAPSHSRITKARELGAVGFLPKPFAMQTLLTLCRRTLGEEEPAALARTATAIDDHLAWCQLRRSREASLRD